MSGDQPRSLPDKRKSTKPKTSILHKLNLLQLNGNFKDPKRPAIYKLFDEFPRRLVFSLSELIEGDDWKSELTFLGFTRDAQFVLSYSCHYSLGGDRLMNRYTYVYYMQWWRFVPYCPLKKIRETKLFGDQEIMDDLTLMVCQWPTDDTKLLVYGSPNSTYSMCMRLDPDVVRCYYITIVAIPALQPCKDCTALRVPDEGVHEHLDNDTADSDDDFQSLNNQKRCLLHSLVIHTRYILVPPYPFFNPFVSMKVDGLVIINTVDNLIVLSIGMGGKSDTAGEKIAAALKSKTPINGQRYDLSKTSSYDKVVGALDFWSTYKCSLCSLNEQNLTKGCFLRDYISKESSKEEHLGKACIGAEICGECGKEILVRWCSRLPIKKDEETGPDFSSLPKRNKLTEECFKDVITQDSSFKQENKSTDEKISTEIKCLTIQLDNAWKESESTEIPLQGDDSIKKSPTLLIPTSQHNFSKHFEKENISPKLGRIIGVVPRLLSPKDKKIETKITEDIIEPNEGALDVPSFGSPLSRPSSFTGSLNEDQDSVASSRDSHAHTHRTSESCVSGNSQYFAEWMEQSPSSPSQSEEDSAGTEYHNVLSFEVHGSQYKLLNQINVEKLQSLGGSTISVRQLNFDIEQFAHEMAAEICKTAQKKYLAFLDYDVQIIDLCEISLNVIALVIMQVQAMTGQKGVAKELRSSVRKVFQTGFKFQWSAETGSYSVIDTDELVEVGFLKENGTVWDPARLEMSTLRREFYIPQSNAKSVRLLSNANLPSGESLKVLWAPGQNVALVH